jgi:hypothetical protein
MKTKILKNTALFLFLINFVLPSNICFGEETPLIRHNFWNSPLYFNIEVKSVTHKVKKNAFSESKNYETKKTYEDGQIIEIVLNIINPNDNEYEVPFDTKYFLTSPDFARYKHVFEYREGSVPKDLSKFTLMHLYNVQNKKIKREVINNELKFIFKKKENKTFVLKSLPLDGVPDKMTLWGFYEQNYNLKGLEEIKVGIIIDTKQKKVIGVRQLKGYYFFAKP